MKFLKLCLLKELTSRSTSSSESLLHFSGHNCRLVDPKFCLLKYSIYENEELHTNVDKIDLDPEVLKKDGYQGTPTDTLKHYNNMPELEKSVQSAKLADAIMEPRGGGPNVLETANDCHYGA